MVLALGRVAASLPTAPVRRCGRRVGAPRVLHTWRPGEGYKKRAKRKLANAVVDAVTTTLNKKAKKKIDDLFSS